MFTPEQKKEWNRKNADRIRRVSREWYLRNREEKLRKNREWKKRNAKKYSQQQSEYAFRRLSEDLGFRLKNRLCSRVHSALRRGLKSARTEELLGCSVGELKRHLESQFKPGMTWETWGPEGWHIDHKRPCVSFDLTDPLQQRECFHFSNLQPLFAKENLSKGGKYVA